MNDNRTLFTHINTDPNAPYHQIIGASCAAFALAIGTALFGTAWPTLGAFLIAGLLAGVVIEIVQRIQGGTNSMRESIMDTLTTALWPLIIMRLWK